MIVPISYCFKVARYNGLIQTGQTAAPAPFSAPVNTVPRPFRRAGRIRKRGNGYDP